MPWKVQTPMSGRRQFVDEYLRRTVSMTTLCACYGISRRIGYKWVTRFLVEGDRQLQDRSRRPLTSPWAVAPEVTALLLEARHRHPTWGPRKILDYLTPRHPQAAWPAPSTIGTLFKRHGLVRPRRRHAKPGHPGRPTTPMSAPNSVWTADFKGHFALRGGPRCHPLTIVDGYSRYLLACQALPHPSTIASRPVFHRLFQEYGLPAVIRSDNGAPFATTALHRLSRLSVWWMKLGIRPELIEPASPQQNGRHERMHRTLKAEATRPPRGESARPTAALQHLPHRVQHGAPPCRPRRGHPGVGLPPLRAAVSCTPRRPGIPRALHHPLRQHQRGHALSHPVRHPGTRLGRRTRRTRRDCRRDLGGVLL